MFSFRIRLRDVGVELTALLLLAPLALAVAESMDLGKYAHWWGAPRGWETLCTTLQVSSLAAAMAVAMAWALASATSRCRPGWTRAVAIVSCLPLLTPSSTMATTWLFLATGKGPLASVLPAIGLRATSIAAAAAVLAARYFGLAVAILLYYQLGRKSNWPAERLFRVPRLTAILRLHGPPAIQATTVAALAVLLFCMNDQIIPGMLLISTYGPQIMIQYAALLDAPAAMALALPVAGVGMLMVAVALRAGRTASGVSREAKPIVPRPRSRGQRALAGALVVAILSAALGGPIWVLVRQTESFATPLEMIWTARGEVFETLLCAAMAGPICSALAALLALRWIAARRAGRLSAAPLVLVNLVIPPSLLGIAMIQASQYWPLNAMGDSRGPLVFAYVVRFLPVAVLGFYVVWRGDSHDQTRAAYVHGVAPWRRAARLTWPRRRPMLLAASVLCGLLAATELEMSILLAPPGRATLGVRLYSLMHTAPDTMVSALTLAILVLVGPGVLAVTFLLARLRIVGGVNDG